MLWTAAVAAAAALAQDLGEASREELRAILADPARFDDHPAAVLELSRRDTWSKTEVDLAAARLVSDDPTIVGSAALALGRQGAAALVAVDRLADLFRPDPEAGPAPGDGPIAAWKELRGVEFHHGWRNIRGAGRGTTIRFVEHDGDRYARVVASTWRAAPHPPRDADETDSPEAVDFEGLSWDVATHAIRIEAIDGGLEIHRFGFPPDARWRITESGDALELDRLGGPMDDRPFTLRRASTPFLARQAAKLAENALRRVLRADGEGHAAVHLLAHPSRTVRLVALGALRAREVPSDAALSLLRCAAASRGVERELAFELFRRIADGARDVLHEALLSGDARLCHAALRLAPDMGAQAEGVASILAVWLIEGGPIDPYEVLRAIGELGRHGAPAAWALARFVAEKRPHHEEALAMLGRIGPAAADAALPVVLHVARTRPGYGHGRLQAVRALGSIAPDHEDLPGLIVACIEDPNDNVVEHTLMWVTGMAPPPEGAVEAIMRLASRKAWTTRRAAAAALGALGRGRQDVSTLLVSMVDDEHPWVRVVAVEALDAVDPRHPRVVPVLRQLLAHADWNIRWHATMACERAGARVRALLPELRAHAADDSEHGHVRRGARNAIAAIEAGR